MVPIYLLISKVVVSHLSALSAGSRLRLCIFGPSHSVWLNMPSRKLRP